MQLPIDIPELFKITTDLKTVADTPLSVSVLLDESAPDALISHVRAAFASAGVHTRVTIAYIDSIPVKVNMNDDMAVIVAGDSDFIGKQAATVREGGVPVMVVCSNPGSVLEIAEESGYPIPQADVIAPEELGHRNPVVGMAQSALSFAKNHLPFISGKDAAAADGESEIAVIEVSDDTYTSALPAEDGAIPLDEKTFGYLDERMGEWILAACHEKELAFALSFPFVRRPLAYNSVSSTSMQNGAIGFVPLIPGADLPIMTLNQAKMILQIATAYGQPLDAARVKEIAAVVAGGFMFRNIARSLSKFVPGAGWVVSGVIGFAGTEAMGRAAIEYFEAGGDIVGLAKVVQTARDEAVDAARKAADTPVGQKVVDAAKDRAGSIISGIAGKS